MSSRKKLVISLSVVAAVVVAAVIAVVAVLAATSQTVTSSIKVSYTAKEVDAVVSASYVSGTTVTGDLTATGEEGGAKTIAFDAAEDESEKALSWNKAIEMDSEAKTIVFTFNFKNTGSATYYAKLTTTNGDETKFTVSEPAVATVAGIGKDGYVADGVDVEVTISLNEEAWGEDIAEAAAVEFGFSWALTTTNPAA